MAYQPVGTANPAGYAGEGPRQSFHAQPPGQAGLAGAEVGMRGPGRQVMLEKDVAPPKAALRDLARDLCLPYSGVRKFLQATNPRGADERVAEATACGVQCMACTTIFMGLSSGCVLCGLLCPIYSGGLNCIYKRQMQRELHTSSAMGIEDRCLYCNPLYTLGLMRAKADALAAASAQLPQ